MARTAVERIRVRDPSTVRLLRRLVRKGHATTRLWNGVLSRMKRLGLIEVIRDMNGRRHVILVQKIHLVPERGGCIIIAEVKGNKEAGGLPTW